MFRSIAIIALASAFSLSAQAADKPIDAKVSEVASKVCPVIASQTPATREYAEDQLTREVKQNLGFTNRETRLLIQKCRNWKA